MTGDGYVVAPDLRKGECVMKARWATVWIVAALGAAGLPALAQQQAPQSTALAGVAARLSARYHVPVMVDPAIVLPPRTLPAEPGADLPLDRAFDALTAQLRG